MTRARQLSLWTKHGDRDAVCARMVCMGWAPSDSGDGRGLDVCGEADSAESVYAFESYQAGGVIVSIVEDDPDDF